MSQDKKAIKRSFDPEKRGAKNTMRRERHERQRAERRAAAEERQAYWQSLTKAEQLKQLKNRPGKSKKQTARINAA